MKRIIPSACLLLSLCIRPGLLSAFTVYTAEDGGFVSWPPERTTIFFRVGSDGSPGVGPEIVEELGAAFQEWQAESRGEIVFIYEGAREDYRVARDGHNTMVWVSRDWPHGPEVAAVSTLWRSEATGMIEEVDIEFNARDYDWTLPGRPALAETALHEIGHLLGIGHSFNPGAVMHHARGSGLPVRRTLTRDDIEALRFLYPRRELMVFGYDVPVIFHPRDFPGESPVVSPAPGFDPGPGRWVTALASVDLTGDGYRSEIVGAVRDERGEKRLAAWGSPEPGEEGFPGLDFSLPVTAPGEIVALSGVDHNRDGRSGQVAVVIRDGGRETLYVYRLEDGGPPFGPEATLDLFAPPANNLTGMSSLGPSGGDFPGRFLLLRAYPGGYSLHLHRLPREDEIASVPDPGIEIPLPGLQAGSRVLGLAALDAAADGRENELLLLELTSGDEFWLHLFSLAEPRPSGFGDYDISYQSSARLPSPPASILPFRITGLDLNRDGFYNQLIILAPGR